MFEYLQTPEVLRLVCLFSVIWFMVGLLTGRMLPRSETAGKTGRKKQAERGRSKTGSEELYVGNLPYGISEKEVRKAFERFGGVSSVRLIEHKNGKSKGYGFVEMNEGAAAGKAIKGLNGKEFKGRSIVVNEARSRKRRSDSN